MVHPFENDSGWVVAANELQLAEKRRFPLRCATKTANAALSAAGRKSSQKQSPLAVPLKYWQWKLEEGVWETNATDRPTRSLTVMIHSLAASCRADSSVIIDLPQKNVQLEVARANKCNHLWCALYAYFSSSEKLLIKTTRCALRAATISSRIDPGTLRTCFFLCTSIITDGSSSVGEISKKMSICKLAAPGGGY